MNRLLTTVVTNTRVETDCRYVTMHLWYSDPNPALLLLTETDYVWTNSIEKIGPEDFLLQRIPVTFVEWFK